MFYQQLKLQLKYFKHSNILIYLSHMISKLMKTGIFFFLRRSLSVWPLPGLELTENLSLLQEFKAWASTPRTMKSF